MKCEMLHVIIAMVSALFFWSVSEARSDRKRIEDLISGIKDDMRKFHKRLSDIEKDEGEKR